MTNIFETIDQVRATVKIAKSISFDIIEPFLKTAQDIYVERYLGSALIVKLQVDDIEESYIPLREMVRMALGPLGMWVGAAELSVRLSDSGFTVEKSQEKFLPASDKKIENVSDSLERRGFQYLDKVLEYLEANKAAYPEWTESNYYKQLGKTFIRTSAEFQELGLVDIQYSRLAFDALRPVMIGVEERYVTDVIGDVLDSRLRTKPVGDRTMAEKKLISYIQKFVACKTAELYSSQAAKRNRESAESKEYKPILRPAYVDVNDTGNFYAYQAHYYQERMQQTLNANATEFGIDTLSDATDFNKDEQHIFFAGA